MNEQCLILSVAFKFILLCIIVMLRMSFAVYIFMIQVIMRLLLNVCTCSAEGCH